MHGDTAIREAIALCGPHFRYAVLFSALINLAFLAPHLLHAGRLRTWSCRPAAGATLLLFTLALILTLMVLVSLEQVRVRIMSAAGVRLDRVFATRLFARAMIEPAGRGGPRVSQLIREADQIRAALTGPAALAVMDAPWTPIYIMVCFMVHPAIGALALGGCIILFGLALWNERVTRGASTRALSAGALSFAAQDAAGSASEVVRSLGMSDAFVERFSQARSRSHLPQLASARATARIGGLIRFLRLLLQSVALGLGAWLAIHRHISAGSIFAASMLASRALAPMDQIVSQWRSMSQAITAYGALRPHLAEPQTEAPTLLPAPKPDLSLAHVTVIAPTRDRALIQDITLAALGGQMVGVLGPSGAGKTTLIELIANAREPDQGEIRIDGARYRDWAPARLGRHIGYLPQAPSLFPGTIKDNISRFDGATRSDVAAIDAEAVAAAKAAEAHDLILGLPSGYDTVIGMDGRGLSAGQRQRIALARALYGEPTLLVLDEPDSALDGEGEMALIRAIGRARARGALVVVAAHGPALLAGADLLAFMEGGRLKMFGPAADVVAALKSTPVGANPAIPQQAVGRPR